MALDFRQVTVRFDHTSGISQRLPFTAVFNSKVRKANAAIKGFKIGFKDIDHELLAQEIDIDPDNLTVSGNTASGNVDFLLQDDTGLGNAFGGYVQVLVIADVE